LGMSMMALSNNFGNTACDLRLALGGVPEPWKGGRLRRCEVDEAP
jgi:hypothetical protein